MSRLKLVTEEKNATSTGAYYRSSDLLVPFRVKVLHLEARSFLGLPVEDKLRTVCGGEALAI